MNNVLLVVVTLILSGCISSEPIMTEKVTTMQNEELGKMLEQQYNQRLAIILGRLDGMNQAIVESLSDSVVLFAKQSTQYKKNQGMTIDNRRKIKALEKKVNKLLVFISESDLGLDDDSSDEIDIDNIID